MSEIGGKRPSPGASIERGPGPGDWRPIETAPRDGTVIRVWSEGDPPYEMLWNRAGSSWCQSGIGIWEHPSGGFTWSEEKGFGPTHWQPLTEKRRG